tara:strand:- start:2234 stop:2752 length:519 start_codon:yes stop_codon:yes gene_type:complete
MVLVTYKGITKNLPDRYLEGLKGKERKAQIKSIFEGTARPKTSFISKKSNWTETFNSVYGKEIEKMKNGRNLKNIAKVSNIPVKALQEVFTKGVAAYYNGGSRPNQTPESWAYARVYSYIMGGNTRKVDAHISKKYNVQFTFFIKQSKTLKKIKIPKKKSVTRRNNEARYIV